MLPITVLPTTTLSNGLDGAGSYYLRRIKSKQKKPFNLASPYLINKVYTHLANRSGPGTLYGGLANAAATTGSTLWQGTAELDMLTRRFDTQRVQSINTAMAKFVSESHESAYLAVNLAERDQAIKSGTHRILQMVRIVKAIRKGNLYDAAKEMNISGDPRTEAILKKGSKRGFPKKKARFKRTKDWSNTFLEFHFGWIPLVNDIYTMVDILQSPFPYGKISVKGKRILTDASFTQAYKAGVQNGYDLWTKGWVRTKVSANVKVSNPNLFLANQLGLTNPAIVAFELTRMSFVADWFFNLSQYMSQFTDFIGLDIDNACYTTVHSVDSKYQTWYPATGYSMFIVRSAFRCERKTGLPGITLTRQYYPQLSLTRALTASALLAQQFLGKR